MAYRKRIYNTVAIKWERNPFMELAKLRAKEMNITVKEAVNLIKLQDELSKI